MQTKLFIDHPIRSLKTPRNCPYKDGIVTEFTLFSSFLKLGIEVSKGEHHVWNSNCVDDDSDPARVPDRHGTLPRRMGTTPGNALLAWKEREVAHGHGDGIPISWPAYTVSYSNCCHVRLSLFAAQTRCTLANRSQVSSDGYTKTGMLETQELSCRPARNMHRKVLSPTMLAGVPPKQRLSEGRMFILQSLAPDASAHDSS